MLNNLSNYMLRAQKWKTFRNTKGPTELIKSALPLKYLYGNSQRGQQGERLLTLDRQDFTQNSHNTKLFLKKSSDDETVRVCFQSWPGTGIGKPPLPNCPQPPRFALERSVQWLQGTWSPQLSACTPMVEGLLANGPRGASVGWGRRGAGEGQEQNCVLVQNEASHRRQLSHFPCNCGPAS